MEEEVREEDVTICEQCGSTDGYNSTQTDDDKDELYVFWNCHSCGHVMH